LTIDKNTFRLNVCLFSHKKLRHFGDDFDGNYIIVFILISSKDVLMGISANLKIICRLMQFCCIVANLLLTGKVRPKCAPKVIGDKCKLESGFRVILF
jgi:hypothetical protein